MKLIPLSQQGKNKGKYFAKVDDADYDRINQWRWQVGKRGNSFYAYRWEKTRLISMHREILSINERDIWVDHKDHDTLNNQRNNIRECTPKQNCFNKTGRGVSKFLGVSRFVSTTKYTSKKTGEIKIYTRVNWVAQGSINGKNTRLGLFKTESEAARKYNEFAKIHYGEFANLNII